MTLATRAHIADPVDAERLFLYLLGILEADPGFRPAWEEPADPRDPFRPEPGPLRLGKATYKHVRKGDVAYHHATTGDPIPEDESEFRSTVGQGLACILEVTYATDGPLVWPPREWDDPDEPPTNEPLREHCVSVDFDTAYGYRDAKGASCGDLHAFLLREVRRFLDALGRPVMWAWYHEERGTWHEPHEIALRGDADRSILNTTQPTRRIA